ncbi:MAG: hypothetical protein RIT25_655 [Planctomycetota bacterium]
MIDPSQDLSLEQAFAELSAAHPGAEVILRPGRKEHVAIVRPAGAPPRAFSLRHGRLRKLRATEDAKLPGAALLADEQALRAILAPHIGAVQRTELVAWRPGRRAVVRIHGSGRICYLKLLDPGSFGDAARVFAALGNRGGSLRLALPSMVDAQHCMHLVDAVQGVALRELVARGIAPWSRVVEAVRELGCIDAQGTGITHDFATARDAAVRMLDKGIVLEPSLEALRAAVAAVPCGPAPRTGTVHGDLHDKQVFFGADAAMLIDLESMGRGDPRFDQANLAEHLRLRSLQQSGVDDGVGAHVLDQLDFAAGPDRNAFLAVVRARLCGVYALRPRWKTLVHRLRDETLSLIESCR